MDVLVIADDATGALETGATLVESGLQALVTVGSKLEPKIPALVVDTETRHVTGETARDHLAVLSREAQARGVRYIYKKTDSTLRGNIGAELQGLLDVFPDYPIVYVPAWPLLGRTVRNGQLFVNDLPLEQTAFAQDPRSPVRTGSINELLRQTCGATVRIAADSAVLQAILDGGATGQVVVCDGSDEKDLEALASVLTAYKAPYIAVGPTGFLGYWIRKLLPSASWIPTLPDMRKGLVVSGSLHPLSVQQVGVAECAGLPVFCLSPLPSDDPDLIAAAAAALGIQQWAGLVTSSQIHSEAEAVAERLGSITRAVLTQEETDALVVFGGDTTLALLQALGIETVTPCKELQPGIPLSTANFAGRRLALITKAGGFGDTNFLAHIRQCQQQKV